MGRNQLYGPGFQRCGFFRIEKTSGLASGSTCNSARKFSTCSTGRISRRRTRFNFAGSQRAKWIRTIDHHHRRLRRRSRHRPQVSHFNLQFCSEAGVLKRSFAASSRNTTTRWDSMDPRGTTDGSRQPGKILHDTHSGNKANISLASGWKSMCFCANSMQEVVGGLSLYERRELEVGAKRFEPSTSWSRTTK